MAFGATQTSFLGLPLNEFAHAEQILTARDKVGSTMRGKLAILVILGIACSAAVFAIWYNRSQTRRISRFLGAPATVLIVQAQVVDFLQLATPTESGDKADLEILTSPAQTLVVLSRRDISEAPGLTHLRHALRQDVSYTWNDSATRNVEWPYALQFIDEQRRVTLLFHPQKQLMMMLGGDSHIALGDKLAHGLRIYVDQLVGRPESRTGN